MMKHLFFSLQRFKKWDPSDVALNTFVALGIFCLYIGYASNSFTLFSEELGMQLKETDEPVVDGCEPEQVSLYGEWAIAPNTGLNYSSNSLKRQTIVRFSPAGEVELRMPPVQMTGMYEIEVLSGKPSRFQIAIDGKPFGSVEIRGGSLLIDPENENVIHKASLKRITSWKGVTVDNRPNGLWSEILNVDGSVRTQIELKLGERHGRSRAYHHDGEIASEAEYRNGVKHGKESVWGPGGQLATETMYADGKLHGASTVYDEHGNILGMLLYRHGDPWSGKYVSLGPTFRLVEVGEYSLGRRIGVWHSYDLSGVPLSDTLYATP